MLSTIVAIIEFGLGERLVYLNLSGEELECLYTWELDMTMDRNMEAEVSHRMGEGAKILGTLRMFGKKSHCL